MMRLRHPYDAEDEKVPWSRVAVFAIALFGPQILAFLLNAVLPIRPEQAELVHAGSGIIGLFTALFVWYTFGRIDSQLPDDLKRFANLPADRPPPSEAIAAPPRSTEPQVDHVLAQMSRHDPAFSEVDLHQWIRALAPTLFRADEATIRHQLRPYALPNAWQSLTEGHRGASDLQVGRLVIRKADHGTWDSLMLGVGLRILNDGQWSATWQRWILRRSTSARSLPLQQMLSLGCPSCGSPVHLSPPEWACEACDRWIAEGQFHWQVREILPRLGGLHPQDWVALPDGEPHPSVRVEFDSQRAAAELRGLAGRHPELELPALDHHVRALAVAYATLDDLPGMEAVQAWRRDQLATLGLKRTAEPPEVIATELLAAGQDGWYDRVDVRVVLRGIEALHDAQGRLIHGHPTLAHERALCVRLAQPSAGPCPADGFRCWQVLHPAEYRA